MIILHMALFALKLLESLKYRLCFGCFVEVILYNKNNQRCEFIEFKKLEEKCNSWAVNENIIRHMWK